MKKLNLHGVNTIFKKRECRILLQFVFICVLSFCVWICFQLYPKWNEIPNQTIKANMIALGDVSDSSSCNFAINVNAGSYHNTRMDKDSVNRMTVWHRSKSPVCHDLDENFQNRFKEVFIEYRDELKNMRTFYVLDYYCSTSIIAAPSYSDHHHDYDTLSFSYIDRPQPCIEPNGISYSGSGFVAFAESIDKKLELRGKGELSFNTNLINGKPEMRSSWDITQANYQVSISCENISCDTISIEFYGATIFSNMHPEPDKISMSGIEFTSPDKVEDIIKNGLRFHTEFLELKGLAAQRSFILAALVSLLIAVFCELLFKLLVR